MPEQIITTNYQSDIEPLGEEIFETLSRLFPVCMSSDEFHYFPQAISEHHEWSRWDDFSDSSLTQLMRHVSNWKSKLMRYSKKTGSTDDAITQSLLCRILKTLEEHLDIVRPHKTQPTFHLTIAAIGLTEAYEKGPFAFQNRIQSLPEFIERAERNLRSIPELFLEMGLEIIRKLISWLVSLNSFTTHMDKAIESLTRLEKYLQNSTPTDDFRMPVNVYDRIARDHMGCEISTDEIAHEINQEIKEAKVLLCREAEKLSPGNNWQSVISNLPSPRISKNGIKGLYGQAITELSTHCVAKNIAPLNLVETCPVIVEEIPNFLKPVRSSAAYSMPPGYPPRGGTFFIDKYTGSSVIPKDYRLLTAHETLPGHHLLDNNRWQLKQKVRRHIEFPIFYEGWASLSEEILFDTGFFSGPEERLLLAKRRLWRAIRGKVDLEIHTTMKELGAHVSLLTENGVDRLTAQRMIKRYALKPGYQLSYSIGRRKFNKLYSDFIAKGSKPDLFVRIVLSQGEIGFEDLSMILARH